MKTKKKAKSSDALNILYREFYDGKPDRLASLQVEYLSSRIARAIYDLRKSAGMTQAELAAKLGTRASAISRLENSDYDGHSLLVLKKLATLFSGRLEIRIVPAKKSQKYLISPTTGSAMKDYERVIA